MVVRVPVSGGVAGAAVVFATGINGADGLEVDEDDNVWVVANQADEIVVVDPTGRAIAKLGDFDGLARDGAARGLLFPASLRLSGKDVLVTNLALDLRLFDPAFTSVDSAWCAEVTLHTDREDPAPALTRVTAPGLVRHELHPEVDRDPRDHLRHGRCEVGAERRPRRTGELAERSHEVVADGAPFPDPPRDLRAVPLASPRGARA